MDKPWAERRRLGGALWDDFQYNDEYNKNMIHTTLNSDTYGEVLKPQAEARKDVSKWEDHSNAWSAAFGAMFGAGIVLLVAALLLMWRRPKKRDTPTLAPLDLGHNGVNEQTDDK